MSKGEVFWFKFVKLAIWTAAILLFFRILGYLLGGHFRELWLAVAVLCTAFITFLVEFLKRFRLPGDGANEPTVLPVQVTEAGNAIAMTTTGNRELMTDDNQDSGTKILHINHGTAFHNALAA